MGFLRAMIFAVGLLREPGLCEDMCFAMLWRGHGAQAACLVRLNSFMCVGTVLHWK